MSNNSYTEYMNKLPRAVTFMTVGFTILFAAMYTASASLGIKTYNECKALQGVKKWDDLNMLLSHTMAMGLVIPVVIVTQYLAGSGITAGIAMLYGIMGIIGNASAYAMITQEGCTESTDKDAKNYIIVGIAASTLIFLGASAFLGFKKS